MDHDEILPGSGRNRNARDAFGGRRKRGKKSKRQMPDRIAELRAVGSVPGIDRIEGFQLRDPRSFHHAEQVQARIGDGARAVGEADQRKDGAGSPDFGVVGARGFQRGQGEDHIANGARPDEKSSG